MAAIVEDASTKKMEFLGKVNQTPFPQSAPAVQAGRVLRQVLRKIEKEYVLKRHTDVISGLSDLLVEIGVGAKMIALNLARASIVGVLGYTGEENVQGEQVKYMDELSNYVMMSRLLDSGLVASVVTEEEELPQITSSDVSGKFCVAMDPLDGSSNIDCNIPTGTIFGIHVRKTPVHTPATEEDYLRKGSELLCAGYVLYGPAVLYVLTVGDGVYIFTYDTTIGEFVLTQENVRIPDECKNYSTNEGNVSYWYPEDVQLIEYFQAVDKATKRPIQSRYVGSLVADFHRNMLYGGIFFYPRDKKDKKKPNGKLRYMYECSPLSFLAEQAGGMGSTGLTNVLDYMPTSVHDRVPLYLGNKKEVMYAMALHEQAEK